MVMKIILSIFLIKLCLILRLFQGQRTEVKYLAIIIIIIIISKTTKEIILRRRNCKGNLFQ